ncbi:MAG TPA: hypothetical protein VK555_11295, partial [Terriglobales bacterium]|nr:hypothetical protein [Terriglobales bacterium]
STSADRGAHTANTGPIPWPGARHRASGMTSRLRGMRGRRVLAPIGQEAQPPAASEPSAAAETITKH